ncbi:DUF6090 family protein [Maribacter sp. 1_2014MBL_MicDiv]|uniref:DUF6090 family protein n=1 Tax=Maribacter sp. 1_2014MBL_MicDiv TaxID=1644130 RepID=UPI0008F5116E|nr:DUF6090 family protein [Maribacter sp. 1_2014MBL_MicDiv]
MIKFFRKIRQKLLSENKFGKYLTYAIGEIVLVVIGILIALQINNWNEEHKANLKELTILKSLEKEFNSNKAQLNSKIEHRNTIIKNCRRLLDFYNKPELVERDSIMYYLSSIVPTTFDPVQNDFVNSGTLEILKNEELKQLLINWSTDVIQLQEVEQMFLRYAEQDIISYTTELGLRRDLQYYFWNHANRSMLESNKVSNLVSKKTILKTLTKDDLMANSRLEGSIAQSLVYNMFNNQESETLMKRIDTIIQILNSEIEK